MQCYRINHCIIAADIVEEAEQFFRDEVGEPIESLVEVSVYTEVSRDDGALTTVRDLMNEELDRRSAWLRMGVPCELHWPFIVVKLKR
ncbi:MAG TPA: hypothetical protein P5551_11985 [Syntrophales bacterium]|nr:hypothetical protein [Syntrophales bacterium]HRT63066.1 hypothetical protein [Syntrophales bacterium]